MMMMAIRMGTIYRMILHQSNGSYSWVEYDRKQFIIVPWPLARTNAMPFPLGLAGTKATHPSIELTSTKATPSSVDSQAQRSHLHH